MIIDYRSDFEGGESVEKIIISSGIKECGYHTVAEHCEEIIRNAYWVFKNLNTIYFKDEFPSGLDLFKDNKIDNVQIVWGYNN